MGKFYIKKSKDNQFYFILDANNKETILLSEMYIAKISAQDGINAVKENAPLDIRYERKINQFGQYFFVLRSGNNKVIGNSEMYTSLAARENGINAVKVNAPSALVEDLTV